MELEKETYEWLMSLSVEKSNTAEDGSMIDPSKSGSGHSKESVNGSTGAFVMCALFLLIASTLYMIWRVYFNQKYLTDSWKKEFGTQGTYGSKGPQSES